MAHQSETDLLAQRLDEIRLEKAGLMKRVDELSADEERISYALEVFRSVVATVAVGELASGSVASTEKYARIVLASAVPAGPANDVTIGQRARARVSLEALILEAFNDWTRMTSGEVADAVERIADAKRESILSTLSRMTSRGLVRREGKLYYRVTKGEGSGVVGTPDPSGATTSGDGLGFSEAKL